MNSWAGVFLLVAVVCAFYGAIAAVEGHLTRKERERRRWEARRTLRYIAWANCYSGGAPLKGGAMRNLSPRQQQILDLLEAGEDTEGVAATLGISESTVSSQLERIRLRYGLPEAAVNELPTLVRELWAQ